jgi:hypothetical protein
LPAGWQDHAASGFHIALPERWEVVDVEESGVEAIWNLLEGLNSEWARNTTATISAQAAQEALKFWAMDSEAAGVGYATAAVTLQSQPFDVEIDDFCEQVQSLYEQMGLEVLASECSLEINGLDAARFTVSAEVGPIAAKMYLYLYVRENKAWAVAIGVDSSEWSEYESTFAIAGESFWVD